MVIKLLPAQIVAFWEPIKFALVQANEVPPEREQDYMNHALTAFLCERFQCWVTLEETPEGKQIVAIGVTSIMEDSMLGYKYLYIDAVFGFRAMADELAVESLEAAKKFAKANNCVMVKGITKHLRVRQLGALAGFEETATVISYTL